MCKRQLLVVAGGSGIRMKEACPKQFIEIEAKPILIWTLQAFVKIKIELPYIIILPKQYFDLWNNLCKKHNFNLPYKLIGGGNTRFESVKNGLEAINDNSIVAIHDGVRPFVSSNVVEQAFVTAEEKGNAIPVVKLKDSIRKVNGKGNSFYDRDVLRNVQTPQVFKAKLIKAAYQQKYSNLFTDDATVLEKAGYEINLIEGNYENFKITSPSDLEIAKAMMKNHPY